MYISVDGVDLIKEMEGLRLSPYKDISGYATIGYGHKIEPGEKFGTITRAQAEALLRKDVQKLSEDITGMVRVDITQGMLDGLGDFGYNVGANALRSSTLLRKLNAYDYKGASNEFKRWNKAMVNGQSVVVLDLVKRRKRDQNLFDSEGYPGHGMTG